MELTISESSKSASTEIGDIDGIPVRNLWLLMFYASDLFRQIGSGKIDVEESPDDIPDLIAEHLATIVEHRLKRNLSFGYRSRNEVLSRVRGRIDLLKTERHQLLSRGMVACRYEDLTINTPRNCYVRSALETVAAIVKKPAMSRRCRALAGSLRQVGVTGERPTKSAVSAVRFGRHDAEDQTMVAAAHLAFELALPTERLGPRSLLIPERNSTWVRTLYEKAVAGFYKVALPAEGWRVDAGKTIGWQIEGKTSGIDNILPAMRTDIVLNHHGDGRRIVIDTKFTSVLKRGWYRDESLSSRHIYQIYAYLRSQEKADDHLALNADGLLLHPSVDEMVDETVVIQGHAIRFTTLNLGASAIEIRNQLIGIVGRQGGIHCVSSSPVNLSGQGALEAK